MAVFYTLTIEKPTCTVRVFMTKDQTVRFCQENENTYKIISRDARKVAARFRAAPDNWMSDWAKACTKNATSGRLFGVSYEAIEHLLPAGLDYNHNPYNFLQLN